MAEIGKTTPKVGMRFRDSEEAWEFWVDYGGHVGFDVRKRSTIKSRSDGVITSRWFVCSNEGHRRKNQTDHEPKRIRAKTRTNCKAHVIVTYDRVAKNFEVTEVDLEHNHRLQLPQTRHLLASQRKISELQAFEIETADDSGIMPKAAHEFACRRVGGNLSYTCRDQKNHLRSKRQRELAYGQAGSMLKYFRDKQTENAAFKYHLQLDSEEHIANIFWADAKMLLDYAHFGDVVTFDTTFGTNKEYRPFGIFLGLNQFRKTTIFGAALMFDETRDSFIWLFETFLAAHNGRQPRTIYTDQDAAMGKAIEKVFTDSYHGLCTFDTRNVVENPKMEAELRYKDLSHKFHKLAQQAANSPQCCFLLDNALDSIAPHIHDLLNASTSAMNELCKDKENVDPNVQQVDDELLRSARLKKKEIPSKNLRRKKTWLDKLLKGKHRVTKGPTKHGEKQQKKKDGEKKDGVQQKKKNEVNLELQEGNAIISYTQLLMAPSCDDDLF